MARRSRRQPQSLSGARSPRHSVSELPRTERSDERVREHVCASLTDDPRVDATEIDVSVGGGEVILSGTVLTRAEKSLAQDLAQNVSGVWNVQNCLSVAVSSEDAP
jgi:osmotically-inducible protein OsmY